MALMVALNHPFFDELRQDPEMILPNGHPLPRSLFIFSDEEKQSASPELLQDKKPVIKKKDEDNTIIDLCESDYINE